MLVDTNVLSELMRPAPHSRVVAWAKRQEGFSLSVVSLEEILYGLAFRPNPRVERWFAAFVAEHCEVLKVTERKLGRFILRSIPITDSMIILTDLISFNQLARGAKAVPNLASASGIPSIFWCKGLPCSAMCSVFASHIRPGKSMASGHSMRHAPQ